MDTNARPTSEEKDIRQRISRIEKLVEAVERFTDHAAREQVRELLQTVLEIHADALDRILERVAAAGSSGITVIDSMANDEVISGVLLLHGLHPAEIETRVHQALEQVRPLLRSHGGNVELVSIQDGVVRLRMQGSCKGCPSSSATLKNAIEQAVYEKAPDIVALEVEGVVEPEESPHSLPVSGFVPVENLLERRLAVKALA